MTLRHYIDEDFDGVIYTMSWEKEFFLIEGFNADGSCCGYGTRYATLEEAIAVGLDAAKSHDDASGRPHYEQYLVQRFRPRTEVTNQHYFEEQT